MNFLSTSRSPRTVQKEGGVWTVQSRSAQGQARAHSASSAAVGAGVPWPTSSRAAAPAARPAQPEMDHQAHDNREISRMNKSATPITPQRLEHIVQLPLGTVLTDNAGIPYEFIGTRANKVGAEFLFVRGESRLAEPEAFSLFSGALLKFPGLAGYVSKEQAQ